MVACIFPPPEPVFARFQEMPLRDPDEGAVAIVDGTEVALHAGALCIKRINIVGRMFLVFKSKFSEDTPLNG